MSRFVLLLILAAPTLAHAYPLNDGQGTVVWGFEGHGSDAGGTLHTFDGELRVGPVVTGVTALVDGSLDFSGVAAAVLSLNTLTGDSFFTDVTAAPSFMAQPVSQYAAPPAVVMKLIDSDGLAFENGPRTPSGGILPPPYAPDIGLFETHQIDIVQQFCTDIGTVSQTSLCSEGGGERAFGTAFSITIDRFIDPVPEPGWLGAVALALLATRRAATRR